MLATTCVMQKNKFGKAFALIILVEYYAVLRANHCYQLAWWQIVWLFFNCMT